MRTVYDLFPEIDNISNFRKRHDFPHIKEEEFWEIYEKYIPFTLLGVLRMYDCFESIRQVAKANIAGNIVECGVYLGGCAAAMSEWAVKFGLPDRQFFLCDTFDGFPDQTSEMDLTGAQVTFGRHESTRATVAHVLTLTCLPWINSYFARERSKQRWQT